MHYIASISIKNEDSSYYLKSCCMAVYSVKDFFPQALTPLSRLIFRSQVLTIKLLVNEKTMFVAMPIKKVK